jgi:hypothetical protein
MKEHIIVAVAGGVPAKVECISCHKQHNFRAHPPGAAPAKKPRTTRAATAKVAALAPSPPPALEDALNRGERDARTYSPKDKFAVGDVIRHPTFGLGLVTAKPAPQKVEIAFRQGPRLLLCDRDGVTPSAIPSRPSETSLSGTSDAPPPRR